MSPPMGVSSELLWLLFQWALGAIAAITIVLVSPLFWLLRRAFLKLEKRVDDLDRCVDRRFEDLYKAREEGYERQQQRHEETVQRLSALEANAGYTHETLRIIDQKLGLLLTQSQRTAGGGSFT